MSALALAGVCGIASRTTVCQPGQSVFSFMLVTLLQCQILAPVCILALVDKCMSTKEPQLIYAGLSQTSWRYSNVGSFAPKKLPRNDAFIMCVILHSCKHRQRASGTSALFVVKAVHCRPCRQRASAQDCQQGHSPKGSGLH